MTEMMPGNAIRPLSRTQSYILSCAHSSGANNDNNTQSALVASLRNLLILSGLLQLACGLGLNSFLQWCYAAGFMNLFYASLSLLLCATECECNLLLHPGISWKLCKLRFYPFAMRKSVEATAALRASQEPLVIADAHTSPLSASEDFEN